MVRTIVIRVDARATGLEQLRDMAMHVGDDRFGEKPARHARLVRDEDDAKTGPVQHADRIDRPRIQLDAFLPIQIADFFDQRAVPIEKHRRCHSVRRASARTAATPTPRIHR